MLRAQHFLRDVYKRQGHYLPICLVCTQDYFLHTGVVLLAGQLFGVFGNFVVGTYLAAHRCV